MNDCKHSIKPYIIIASWFDRQRFLSQIIIKARNDFDLEQNVLLCKIEKK